MDSNNPSQSNHKTISNTSVSSLTNHQSQTKQTTQQQQYSQQQQIQHQNYNKLSLIPLEQKLKQKIQDLKINLKQLRSYVEIQADRNTFIQQFYNKISHTSNLSSQSNKLLIQKNIPFFINTNSLINVSPISRIYSCEYRNNSVHERVLQTLLEVKESLTLLQDSKLQKYVVTDEMFNQLYYQANKQLTKRQNLINKQPYSSLIQPLKCKIIDLKEYKYQQICYIMDYLQKLRFYYEYNDIVHSQNLLISQSQRRQKRSLKLFYFNLVHRKQFAPNVVRMIVDYFQNESPMMSSINNSEQDKSSLDSKTATLSLLDYLIDENWQVRQKTVQIMQKAINKNHAIISVGFVQKLWDLSQYNIKQTKKSNVIRLLNISLSRLLGIRNQLTKIKSFSQLQKQQIQNINDLVFLICLALSKCQKHQNQTNKLKNNQLKHNQLQNRTNHNIQDYLQLSKQLKIQLIDAYLSIFYRQLQLIQQQQKKQKNCQNITFSQLNDRLSRNYVTSPCFSSSLNIDLNQKLQTYKDFINNQQIRQANYKQEYLYLISQYHHGRTLKELILNNWKGFQNHNIVHKLATKLFWLYSKFQYSGFNCHIPTLQNIIINQNFSSLDININMTSFINSIQLFQSQNEKNLSQKMKISSIQQLLPFVFSHQNKSQSSKYPDDSGLNKINRIKNLLIVLLFMICRRLNHFEGFQLISKHLKPIIQKDIQYNVKIYKQLQEQRSKRQQQLKKQKQKQKVMQTKRTFLKQNNQQQQIKQKLNKQRFNKLRELYDNSSKYSLFNTLKLMNSNQQNNEIQKGHFINLTFYMSQLYSIFLKKYELPQKDIKQYQMLSYKNSNTYRVNEFQKYLGVKENLLLNTFQNSLVSLNNQNSVNPTWRHIFCLLFNQGEQTLVKLSKLLTQLCRFFEYLQIKQQDSNYLPPQIYFALKFGIDFCYFQQKYKGKWFNCFETFSDSKKIDYDMQTMFLLKNIKSQVIKITNQNVEKMIKIIEKNQQIFVKNQSKLKLTLKQEQNQKMCLRVKAGIDLLKYLNTYQKKVYIKQIEKSNEKIKSRTKITQQNLEQNKLQFFTIQYFQGLKQEDINQLEDILQLFMQKMDINTLRFIKNQGE